MNIVRVTVISLAFGFLPLPASAERASTQDIVDDVMLHLGFGEQHRAPLEAGEILFSGQPGLETLPQGIAVAGAMMLIGRPPHELVDAYLSDETLRSHSDIRAVGAVPATGGDVAALASLVFNEAEQNEVRRLRRAKAGDDLNLSSEEIEKLSAIEKGDQAAAEVVATYRDALWLRLEDYRASGLDGIPAYARKTGRLASPAEEMRASLESAAILRKHFPQMYSALDNYPGSMDAITESSLIWMKKTVAKRPTITLAHRMLLVDGDIAIVAEREFYVAHTYNSMLTLAAVVPHEGGTLIFAANRTFTEKVRGARFKKAMGRKKVGQGFARRFEELRAFLLANPD